MSTRMHIDSPPIGFLGGTFDPIQLGHTGIAQAALRDCRLSQVVFIPCFKPPHRALPIASPADRLAMTKLAIAHFPQFSISTLEMDARNVSYTYKTALMLRQQYPNTPLCFIVGEDAFAQFDTWDEAEVILQNMHLIVVSREGYPNRAFKTCAIEDLHQTLSGKLYHLNISSLPFSATRIRHQLMAGATHIPGLNPKIFAYIQQNNLYNRSVHS